MIVPKYQQDFYSCLFRHKGSMPCQIATHMLKDPDMISRLISRRGFSLDQERYIPPTIGI